MNHSFPFVSIAGATLRRVLVALSFCFLAPVYAASAPTCGDGVVDTTAGEQCDAGPGNGYCTASCRLSSCGDGVVNSMAGEYCEPGLSPGTCSASCVPSMCGDGVVNGIEECDDGLGNSDTTPGACRNSCALPTCGDNVVDPGEDADPPISPSSAVPINPATCQYDFSEIGQLSCNSACGTPWNGLSGCQRADADMLCKLVTGNPASTTKTNQDFNVESVLEAPGVCCPPDAAEPGSLGCVALGNMEQRGVNLVVSVHDSNMSTTHGTGAVVTLAPENCTNP